MTVTTLPPAERNANMLDRIHMLPLLPCSAYVRNQKFVQEEWEAMFASQAADPAEKVQGGWKGVLYANLAIINPEASWNFFAQSDFNYTWIDQGASRTWYLAYAAGESLPPHDSWVRRCADSVRRPWWSSVVRWRCR